jgi:cell division protein FtsB
VTRHAATTRDDAPTTGRRRHAARVESVPPRHRDGDSVWRRAVSGDRPYVVAFFALVALLAMMVIGPLQSYTAAAERVHDLEAARAQLKDTVAELEAREERLQDPEEIELLARQRLGLVKPGEIPYVVTDGNPDTDQVRPGGKPLTPPLKLSLWQRISQAFGALFRR